MKTQTSSELLLFCSITNMIQTVGVKWENASTAKANLSEYGMSYTRYLLPFVCPAGSLAMTSNYDKLVFCAYSEPILLAPRASGMPHFAVTMPHMDGGGLINKENYQHSKYDLRAPKIASHNNLCPLGNFWAVLSVNVQCALYLVCLCGSPPGDRLFWCRGSGVYFHACYVPQLHVPVLLGAGCQRPFGHSVEAYRKIPQERESTQAPYYPPEQMWSSSFVDCGMWYNDINAVCVTYHITWQLQTRWITILSADCPTLAFHASLKNSFGKGSLIHLLRQFAKVGTACSCM